MSIGRRWRTCRGAETTQLACAVSCAETMITGMRRSLSLKDDDYRLSFLYGNFTTLTRFTEADLERVVTEGLSPLYVSIHATDPERRNEMLRNRRGGPSLRWLRALLDLISTTCRNTLWILSLNESALGYLRQVVGMEEYFSHRINAMAVSPRHLKSAILQRHNLSGLRLHFAQPPPEESRRGRIGKLLGLRREPEQNYFDSLYRQSEGIFRSAFELWQESVDRVEGGVLYMRHPVEPSYEGIISRLTLEDSFILQAILQHGGLTPGEIARVFDYSERRSDSCIEKLISWEIIEPDPSNPGFRVCPEAGRLVRQALYRQNLL